MMWVAFTGAGISRPSGIPTFEERTDLRDKLDLDVWRKSPEQVWEAIWEMYQQCNRSQPNPAHYHLAEAGILVVTQNIDGLHQRAGTPGNKLVELHGNLAYGFCTTCNTKAALSELEGIKLPRCGCGGLIKPDVVLYQEPVDKWFEAFEVTSQATVLLVIGTSLTVAPAAHLPEMARRNGAKVYIINKDSERQVPKLLRTFFHEVRQ